MLSTLVQGKLPPLHKGGRTTKTAPLHPLKLFTASGGEGGLSMGRMYRRHFKEVPRGTETVFTTFKGRLMRGKNRRSSSTIVWFDLFEGWKMRCAGCGAEDPA